MPTYRYIVQVHPVENGEPNLHKVMSDAVVFSEELNATRWVDEFNNSGGATSIKAVYHGRVNVATGELE